MNLIIIYNDKNLLDMKKALPFEKSMLVQFFFFLFLSSSPLLLLLSLFRQTIFQKLRSYSKIKTNPSRLVSTTHYCDNLEQKQLNSFIFFIFRLYF